ncbi:MAG: hypothetical protein A2X55_12465 [Nitrospirae bacterium GWB2_47_37]|nr:MAG: hypothetical protein A2Z82_01700 [Nitrospirae bacterium GWA2_46_11]OGW25449.1 MAG: hypothetical protein A2X55_12465 [Nitrospirae bacterium GWB2_47_37]HAK87902.1 hypothetical protein [Nitrospiraceae bacterium]
MSEIVCTSCGFTGESSAVTKGSIGTELVLWLFFLIPGLIYSIWRLSSKYEACPKCKQNTIIPIDSPMGKKFLKENLPDQYSATFEKKYEVNKNGLAWKLGKLVKKIVK